MNASGISLPCPPSTPAVTALPVLELFQNTVGTAGSGTGPAWPWQVKSLGLAIPDELRRRRRSAAFHFMVWILYFPPVS